MRWQGRHEGRQDAIEVGNKGSRGGNVSVHRRRAFRWNLPTLHRFSPLSISRWPCPWTGCRLGCFQRLPLTGVALFAVRGPWSAGVPRAGLAVPGRGRDPRLQLLMLVTERVVLLLQRRQLFVGLILGVDHGVIGPL